MEDASDHVRALVLQQQRKRECLNNAVMAGAQSAVISLVVAGGLSYSLARASPFFRSHFTVGSKAAFIALPVFFSFWCVGGGQDGGRDCMMPLCMLLHVSPVDV